MTSDKLDMLSSKRNYDKNILYTSGKCACIRVIFIEKVKFCQQIQQVVLFIYFSSKLRRSSHIVKLHAKKNSLSLTSSETFYTFFWVKAFNMIIMQESAE